MIHDTAVQHQKQQEQAATRARSAAIEELRQRLRRHLDTLDETPAPPCRYEFTPGPWRPMPKNRQEPRRTAAGTQCLIGEPGTREVVNWCKQDPYGIADGLSLAEFKKQDAPQPKPKPLTLAQQQAKQKRRERDERASAKKQQQRRAVKLKAEQEAARAALAAEPPDPLDLLEAKADPRRSRGHIPRVKLAGQAHHHHPTSADLDALRELMPGSMTNREIMSALRQICGIPAP